MYNHFKEKGFDTKFSLKSALDMTTEAQLIQKMGKDMVCLIYGASKMVIKDEQKDLRQYQTLEMVEF